MAYDSPELLPTAFWSLHTAAKLTAVGPKARPIACGDTLRRLFAGLWCRKHRHTLVQLLSRTGQFGVGIIGGAERMACVVETIAQAGGIVLSLDAANAFNTISWAAVLKAVAAEAPALFPYVCRVYGSSSTPWLLHTMPGQAKPAVVLSEQGVQQGDPFGPVLFALALNPALADFIRVHPHLSLTSYLDDMTIGALPLASSAQATCQSIANVAAAQRWMAGRLQPLGPVLKPEKSVCYLAPIPAAQQQFDAAVEAHAKQLLPDCRVDRQGIVIVGAPVGSNSFVADHIMGTLFNSHNDSLLAGIVSSRDTQLALALLRLCYVTKATYLARNTAPLIAAPVLSRFDATAMAAFAAIIQEPVQDALLTATEHPSQWDRVLNLIRADAWRGEPPVQITALQQAQIPAVHPWWLCIEQCCSAQQRRMPSSHGGAHASRTAQLAAAVSATAGASAPCTASSWQRVERHALTHISAWIAIFGADAYSA